MKNLRKIATLLLALSIMLCAFSLTACNTGDVDQSTSGSVTLVVKGAEEKSYTVSLDGLSLDKGLVSVLDALKAEGKLDYGITDTFLDYVGDVKNDYEKGEYVYIYTSVTADQDVSEYKETVTYQGTELVSAGVGAIEMTVEDGAIFYVSTVKW